MVYLININVNRKNYGPYVVILGMDVAEADICWLQQTDVTNTIESILEIQNSLPRRGIEPRPRR